MKIKYSIRFLKKKNCRKVFNMNLQSPETFGTFSIKKYCEEGHSPLDPQMEGEMFLTLNSIDLGVN